jgi:LacI family repressor for deo operon, udp, cdd, tsx, nupC, and nupG
MGRYKKSTIKEVAALAGVSTTTVSYFVSGREDVCSAQTAERIRKAVAELHYTPSSLVVGMQKSTQRAVGALISSPWDPDVDFAGFFYERIWKGIYEEADRVDYSILRYAANVRYSDKAETFLDGRVDGLLFHDHVVDNDRPEKIANAGLPIVLLTRSINIPDSCGAVYSDGVALMRLALDRLSELGHRRIAHLAGPVGLASVDDIAVERIRGYEIWMNGHGGYDPALLRSTDAWHGADVIAHLEEWRSLDNPPTAVLCANDDIAVSAIEAARQIGWIVPSELSVVGIDNSSDPRVLSFNLTTIDPHIDRVGSEGLKCVLNIIGGEQPEVNRKAIGGAEWIGRKTASAQIFHR